MIFLELTTLQIIGNVIALFGMVFLVLSTTSKSKGRLFIFQNCSHAVNILSELCLAQYPAMAQEATNIIRNTYVISKYRSKIVSTLIVIIGFVTGVLINYYFKDNDPWGYLPIIAVVQYSIVILMPNIKLPQIKGSMIISLIMWSIYNFVSLNFVMGAFNIVVMITSAISIIKYYKDKKKEKSDLNVGD